jgi:hypothetical protein
VTFLQQLALQNPNPIGVLAFIQRSRNDRSQKNEARHRCRAS